MKKIYCAILVVLIVLMIPAVAFATVNEIDLSGMSYDELVELKDRINLAIWESQEWEEVVVPQGVWQVGVDIPAGKWTISAEDGACLTVFVGDELKQGGTKVQSKTHESIYSPNNKFYDEKIHVTEWTIELEDGRYVQIMVGNAVFTPYAGKPSLGFKQG